MLQDHLLRIETVNLAHVLDDTNQIGVIRGGSLAALFGAELLADEPRPPGVAAAPHWPLLTRLLWRWRPQYRPSPVSLGASVGLYRLRAWPSQRAGIVAALARQLVRAWPHHTFVVDAEPLPTPDAFPRAHEALIARNRFRQLRQPGLAFPAEVANCQRICALDQVRPAAPDARLANAAVSASVRARGELGSAQKAAFLAHESGLTGIDYAQSFEEIATFPRDGDTPPDPLDGKLGVLYLDGNGFGKHQAGCATCDELQAFDKLVKDFRRHWLRRLIEHLHPLPAAWYRPADGAGPKRLRLEVLLWGGDEVLVVLPAGLALAATQLCFDESRAAGDAGGWTWQGEPLTHAAGLVLCQHKTPIARVRDLARRLADDLKQHPDARRQDRWDYLVLESVDAAGLTPADHRRQRYGAQTEARAPLWPAASLHALADLAALRNPPQAAAPPPGQPNPRLALGKLRELLHGLTTPPAGVSADAAADAALAGITALLPPAPHPQQALPTLLDQVFPGQAPQWQWLHLIELWDYLAPRDPEAQP